MGGLLRRTEDLFHYTSADVGVFSILADRRIRLSSYESTNDPAESGQKFPSISIHQHDRHLAEGEGDIVEHVWQEADWWLRRYIKLACFTEDFERPEMAMDMSGDRGWNHPSLWAHYAGNFGGLCLRFDRTRLVSAFDRQQRGVGLAFAGPVTYPIDRFSALPAYGLDIGQVAHFGIDAVVTRYIERFHEELFFTKEPDWASEREFRLLLCDTSLLPRYVDIADCLTGVVIGHRFPQARRDALEEVLTPFDGVDLMQVQPSNGKLLALPLERSSRLPLLTPRLDGPVHDRVERLRSAEDARAAAEPQAEAATSGVQATLRAAAQTVAAMSEGLPRTRTEVHAHAMAIPEEQRRRAAGLPGESVILDRGWISVTTQVLDDGSSGVTLVTGLAMQVLEPNALRLHAAAWTETPGPEGGRRSEVWRTANERPLVEGAQAALALVTHVMGRTDESLSAFSVEVARSPVPDESATAP